MPDAHQHIHRHFIVWQMYDEPPPYMSDLPAQSYAFETDARSQDTSGISREVVSDVRNNITLH
jgi:hypothetical protein